MASVKIADNGPFDPRITSIPFLQKLGGQKKLTRGFIIQEKAVGGVRYRCSFLYNPSVVNLSHGTNGNVVADENALNPNDVTKQKLLMPLQQTLQFNLLFDRTYELWDPSKMSGQQRDAVTRFGVAYDILSLYKITGVATPMEVSGEGTDATGESIESFAKGKFSNGPVGPMLYVPVYCVIGTSLSYYGVIQNMDIQFTHWTQDMIPSRGQVGITVQLLPAPTGGNAYNRFSGDDSKMAGKFVYDDDSKMAPSWANSSKSTSFNGGAASGRGGR